MNGRASPDLARFGPTVTTSLQGASREFEDIRRLLAIVAMKQGFQASGSHPNLGNIEISECGKPPRFGEFGRLRSPESANASAHFNPITAAGSRFAPYLTGSVPTPSEARRLPHSARTRKNSLSLSGGEVSVTLTVSTLLAVAMTSSLTATGFEPQSCMSADAHTVYVRPLSLKRV